MGLNFGYGGGEEQDLSILNRDLNSAYWTRRHWSY